MDLLGDNGLIAVQRSKMLDFLEDTMLESQTLKVRTGLVSLEVSQFKRISVTYGYERTQQLLAAIFTRLSSQLPRKDKIFFLGRNEFVIVLVGLKVVDQIHLAINKIRSILADPFVLGDSGLRVRCRLGGTVSSVERMCSSVLLQQADTALLEAQDGNRDSVIFSEPQGEKVVPGLELQAHLEQALDRNELTSVFQPKTELATGKLAGAETLTRWHSKALGHVSPDDFIDAAEKSGLISRLTAWSIHSAAKQYSQWGKYAVPVAVNLSAGILQDPDLMRHIQSALHIWGVPPGALSLEITETAFMQSPEASLAVFQELYGMGIRLSIDDFGTGYSSLSYLKLFPVSELKIDKSFVSHMLKDVSDQKIVKTVADLAHNFDLKVVAEGIEDEKTYDMLLELGCHYAQGYLISKPLTPQQFLPWAKANNWYRPAPGPTFEHRRQMHSIPLGRAQQ